MVENKEKKRRKKQTQKDDFGKRYTTLKVITEYQSHICRDIDHEWQVITVCLCLLYETKIMIYMNLDLVMF